MIRLFSFIIGLSLAIYSFNQPYNTPTIINIIFGLSGIIYGIYPLFSMSYEDSKWFPLIVIHYLFKFWYIIITIIICLIVLLTHYIWK